MILTILSHIAAVRILFIIGITAIVLPIFLYKAGKGKLAALGKALKWTAAAGIIMCLPMVYYFYLDIRYQVGDFSVNDKLYLAAENKNHSAAHTLLSEGGEPDGENRYGRTALYRAVMLDDTEMVELLLESGADPDHTGNERLTPLGRAAENGCTENVRLLLAAGADPDYMTDKYPSALSCAAAYDENYNSELVRLLIDAGADPASQSVQGGKIMLPYRYYYDRHKADEGTITEEEEQRYVEISDMLYEPYIKWLKTKMESENERMKQGEEIS